MLITRETDYALRVLRALAGGGRMTAEEICREELLPRQFVYKILKKLEKAGLISIARGAEGGCRLCSDLKKFSLYDLAAAMGEDRSVNACMQAGFRCAWRESHSSRWPVLCQRLEVQIILDSELRARSLHRMLFGPSEENSIATEPETGLK